MPNSKLQKRLKSEQKWCLMKNSKISWKHMKSLGIKKKDSSIIFWWCTREWAQPFRTIIGRSKLWEEVTQLQSLKGRKKKENGRSNMIHKVTKLTFNINLNNNHRNIKQNKQCIKKDMSIGVHRLTMYQKIRNIHQLEKLWMQLRWYFSQFHF